MIMDVEKIVDKMSEMSLIRTHKPSGDWYQCYCPFHNDGNEKRPSFGILLRDQYRNGVLYPEGFSHCFTCSYAGSLADTITKILSTRSITKSGESWLAENVEGYESDDEFDRLISGDIMDAAMARFAVDTMIEQETKPVEYVSEEELASYRYVVPYMYERKLTDEIIAKYDVGVDMNWIPKGRKKPIPCITFPVNDPQGNTLFICRRSIQGKIYNYPEGTSKPVYGIDKLPADCKSVIICESIINALTAEVYGYDAIALLGVGNSFQIDILKTLGVNEFVICTDGDDAGRRAAARLKKALQSVAIVWVINMPEGKDLNDCSKEEFDELYRQRE